MTTSWGRRQTLSGVRDPRNVSAADAHTGVHRHTTHTRPVQDLALDDLKSLKAHLIFRNLIRSCRFLSCGNWKR